MGGVGTPLGIVIGLPYVPGMRVLGAVPGITVMGAWAVPGILVIGAVPGMMVIGAAADAVPPINAVPGADAYGFDAIIWPEPP